jgi:hypothetical protein
MGEREWEWAEKPGKRYVALGTATTRGEDLNPADFRWDSLPRRDWAQG